ncbi:MAG: tetratricopeptide repeat protein [Kofleriaceae bacterium]
MRGDPTPLDPAYAALALGDATDREQILDLLVRAVRSRARSVALLSVHVDELRGRGTSLRIPRHTVPALEDAIASRQPAAIAIGTGEPFVDGMLEQLGDPTRAALVLPVSDGSRTVAVVVAHDDAELGAAEVTELLSALAATKSAMVRLAQTRAKVAAPAPAQDRHDTSYVVEITQPPDPLPVLRERGAWSELAAAIREAVREGMAHGTPDEDEQLELLLELGRVEADRLGRPDQAIEAWRSALTIEAGEPRILDAMYVLLAQQQRWAQCAEVLDKQVALAEDPQRRVALLLELAAIAHDRLADDEAAIAAYERILNWDPAHELATRALEALYSARAQWEPLAALLLDRASRYKDPPLRIAALEVVARMYEDQVGDPRAAFLVWLTVFRIDPDRLQIVDELGRLAPRAEAWDELLAEGIALAEELEARRPLAAARVWHLVGVWTRDHVGHRDDAAGALERSVALDPAADAPLAELIAMLRADARWVDVASLIARRAELEADPGKRGVLHAQLGELYETTLDDPGEAIRWYEAALADEPEAKPVLVALHRLDLATERWSALADLVPRLIGVLDAAAERPIVLDLHVELGTILVDHLGRAADAVRAFEDALALAPKHAAALEGLSHVYELTGETDALLEAREAEVDAAPTAPRYAEVAAAWSDRGRFDRASACWRKLLAIEPHDPAARAGLARALRGAEAWTELAALLREAREPAGLVELAEVLDDRLDDPAGATLAYRAVLALEPAHRGALAALAQLHDRAGHSQAAIDALAQLLETTPTAQPRAELYQRIGQLYLNNRDLANARIALAQAIALDLDNAGAHEGMARLHLMQGELVAAGEELIQAATLSVEDRDRVRRLADAAWVFQHRLHDPERARQCLHLILELEPDHADAKRALAELLHATAQWESLWPHLEQEVARAHAEPALPVAERLEIFSRAARCALELDRFELAQSLYEQACALDAGPALAIERAEALYRARAFEVAAAAYQTILARHGSTLDPAASIAVYRRLAELQTTLGRAAQAMLFHRKVLELEPHHRGTLHALVELELGRGRVEEAIAQLRALVAIVDPAERVPLLERIGDLYRDQLRNAPRAMSAYLEALEHDPGNRRALQRLLDLQSAAGQWRAATETIERFLEHETDPARRAAYYLASAEIRRTELRDKPGALDAYDRALGEMFREDPLTPATRARGLDTFRLIDELVTADRNWARLEQSYLRMVKRVPKADPVLLPLWHALGEIYRTRLKQYDNAIRAFEIAHALDPEKQPERASVLAELYTLVGRKQPERVVERAAKLVEADPEHPDAYRALGRASLAAGRLDEAWCVARALVFLKLANDDERALYQRFAAHEADKATGILDDDTWAATVRHPDEDRTISALFALVWEAAVAPRAGAPKDFELKPKDRLPVEDGTRVIAKIFRHAARVLNVALPDVYVQPRRSGRLLLANCIERGRLVPAVIVGRDLMTGYRDTELAAVVGAMLSLLRPAYWLRLALPAVEELEAALGAAAAVGGRPGLGGTSGGELQVQIASEIDKRLTRTATAALRAIVARLPERPDLARWRSAVDLASQRAGFLVSGELAAAARMLSTEAKAGARPGQRVQQLVGYSVSPGYFAVRAHLGVTVK